MPEMNRRTFLIAGAGVGAVGLLSGVAAITLPDLLRSAGDRPTLTEGSGVLVIVTLYGGNDGLSTVIPYTDNVYYDSRPELAYAPTDVLPLDGALGLNPGMKGFAQMWNDKRLAVIRGVGYPKPDRSHFRSIDIWQTASPTEPVYTGWIGRWLDATGEDPLRAVNIGAVLPRMMVGEKQTAAALSENSAPAAEQIAETMAALSAEDPGDTEAMSAVCASYRSFGAADEAFAPIVTGDPAASDAAAVSGGLSYSTERNLLAEQLSMVSTCVKAGIPTRVYTVALGGFDTHADEAATQQRLLQTLDDALTPFMGEMGNDKYGKNVVALVYSEFGRRVAANASQGTDHGTAGPVFVVGNPVKGGFYGDQPSLTDLTDGDLKGTVDFRDIYHELLAKTVDTDPEPAVGTGRHDIGFL